eukprot:10189666-Ditylum_brightwellii.AAC.1
MGYNRNMVHMIREGPYQYGGAAITSMVGIQGIEHIKNFIQHIRTPGDAGDLVNIAYRWAQHQTGWHLPILEDVTENLLHFEA